MNLFSVRPVKLGDTNLSAGDSMTFWKIALDYLASSRRTFDQWEDDCEGDRRRGLRPHHCRHGRNMWVDHDIACGQCEELGYWEYNYLEHAGQALIYARTVFSEVIKRRKAMFELIVQSAPIGPELWAWVNEPIKEYI